MIFHLCLRTNENETSIRLVGPGPQRSVESRNDCMDQVGVERHNLTLAEVNMHLIGSGMWSALISALYFALRSKLFVFPAGPVRIRADILEVSHEAGLVHLLTTMCQN